MDYVHLFFRYVRLIIAFALRLAVVLLCFGAAASVCVAFFVVGLPLLLLIALIFGVSTLASRIDPRFQVPWFRASRSQFSFRI